MTLRKSRPENLAQKTKFFRFVEQGADLVIEVVSNEGRQRDLEIKRQEYARAGIAEYWIVDPQVQQITVLALEGSAYVVHGQYSHGCDAESRLLPGFKVGVTDVLIERSLHNPG